MLLRAKLDAAYSLQVFSEDMNHADKEKRLIFAVPFYISRKITTAWS